MMESDDVDENVVCDKAYCRKAIYDHNCGQPTVVLGSTNECLTTFNGDDTSFESCWPSDNNCNEPSSSSQIYMRSSSATSSSSASSSVADTVALKLPRNPVRLLIDKQKPKKRYIEKNSVVSCHSRKREHKELLRTKCSGQI